jgi:RNA polymerase sigma factor (sigma-70 family)
VHDDSLTTLMQRAVDGEEAAWVALVRRFDGLVWSVTGRFALQWDDRQEVCAGVWADLHEKAATVREPEALPGWLRTTARRRCLGVVRRRAAEPAIGLDENRVVDARTPESALLRAEEHDLLWRAVGSLPARCRFLLTQQVVCNAGYAQLATGVGIAESSVGSTRCRCVRALRRRYRELTGD